MFSSRFMSYPIFLGLRVVWVKNEGFTAALLKPYHITGYPVGGGGGGGGCENKRNFILCFHVLCYFQHLHFYVISNIFRLAGGVGQKSRVSKIKFELQQHY